MREGRETYVADAGSLGQRGQEGGGGEERGKVSERVRRKRAKSEKTDTGEKKEVSKAMQSSKVRSIKSVGVKDSLLFFFSSFLPSFLLLCLPLPQQKRKKSAPTHTRKLD